MDKISFFARQQSLRRLTLVLLTLTAIGAIGIACLGGVAAGLAHYQLTVRYGGVVDTADLQAVVLVGAAISFALTLLVVFVHLVILYVSRGASRRFFRARDLHDDRQATLSPAEQRLINVVDEMTLAAAIPRPHVFVLDDDASINSFALVLRAGKTIIGVTAGAMHELSREELQALVAHEVAHIANGDAAINIRLFALIRGFRWLYDISVDVIGWPLRTLSSFRLGFFLTFYLAMAFGIFFVLGSFGVAVARLMQAAIARKREYLADASAIQFLRATDGLLGALDKADRCQQSRKRQPTHAAAFMMFVSPYRARSWLFRTHPKIEQRIKATHAMTPGPVSRRSAQPTSALEMG